MNETLTTEMVKEIRVSKKMYFAIKRLFDIFVGLLGLIVIIPLTIMVKILYMATGDFDPIFYKHKRIGKNGKYIYLYKYRTMVKNADEIKANFTKEQKEEYEKNFKLENDPRITKMGNILRKTSLDEVPQFLNILKGEMSMVGPRPVVDREILKYGDAKDKFLSVKPGLTGWWACNGRSSILDYDERIKLELYYVDHCSLKLDIKCLFMTAIAVIKKDGAK